MSADNAPSGPTLPHGCVRRFRERRGRYMTSVREWWDASVVTLDDVRNYWYGQWPREGYQTSVVQIGEVKQVDNKRIIETRMTRALSCD